MFRAGIESSPDIASGGERNSGIIESVRRRTRDDEEGYLDAEDEREEPRKRVRIRVPVVRSRSERQHKFTVVRRRPLVPYTKSYSVKAVSSPTARRIVVTRVRTLGAANALRSSDDANGEGDDRSAATVRHKVTVTRRRKVQQPTTVAAAAATAVVTDSSERPRVTRKKLITVRPVIQPSSTLAIITTGFFDAPSASTTSAEEEYSPSESERGAKNEDGSIDTPDLEETPNSIEDKPQGMTEEFESPSKFELALPEEPSEPNEPVIITDNFFLPPDDYEESEYDEEYVERDEKDDTAKEEGDENASSPAVDDEGAVARNSSASFDIAIDRPTQEPIDVEDETTRESSTTVSEKPMGIDGNDDATSEISPSDRPIDNDTAKDHSIQSDFDDSSEAEKTTPFSTTDYPDTTVISVSNHGTDSVVSHETIGGTAEIDDSPVDPSRFDSTESRYTGTENKDERATSTPLAEKVDFFSATAIVADETPIIDAPIYTATDVSQSTGIDISPAKPPIFSTDAQSTPDAIESPSNSEDPVKSDLDTVVREVSSSRATTTFASPTPEDIEAGLADDLYLSLSRPDFPEILPSKPATDAELVPMSDTPELSTSVYYTETVVTSTRLRTYTYVVTKLNGQETEVTSSTTVRPRVTTLTLTVPVTVTVSPTMEPSPDSVPPVHNPEPAVDERKSEEGEMGRRFNLATRIMSNGVEVIVAGPTPALRWENPNPQPTLTLSDAVVMLLPRDKPQEFVTKTCTTTFTYLNTITKDGTTIVSTDQQVVANTATEERHRKPVTETAAVTLEASPTLRTEVFKTTYTYLTLNADHPDAEHALESSTKVIANTVTAPQHYLDVILEPSEAPRPETNTYLSTRKLEKTFLEDGKTKIETTSDVVTRLVITESAPPPRPTSVATTLTALDNTDDASTEVVKTYYITYTYFSTFLEKGSTVVHTNVATSTDVVTEKVPIKKTTEKEAPPTTPTPEPIQIFATKTYLTTFTYFTTLLQAAPDGNILTTISSRTQIVENVVTESIAPSLLNTGYMSALMTTAHHSDSVKNVVTGSTIIFFDEEDRIDPTTATANGHESSTLSVAEEKGEKKSSSTSAIRATATLAPDTVIRESVGQTTTNEQGGNATSTSANDSTNETKRPTNSQGGGDLQVSNLLSLGSLGINGLSALGPVISAMAGLLQGKTSASRRNDTAPASEAQDVTTQRSPIYIPVAEFADGDIETAESQNIAAHLANLNHNYLPETRHKVAASLADGIPISPGEVITANSDVIIGKPGKMGPRPPQTFLKEDEHIGMKPPPLPVPDVPVHPVLEVVQDNREDSQAQQSSQGHRGSIQSVQILPARQVFEEHLKVPATLPLSANPPIQLTPKHPLTLQHAKPGPPKRIGSSHDIMKNDPLLKPPGRPNVERYANPNTNVHEPEWSPEKYRRPWSAKDPLGHRRPWNGNEGNVPSGYDEIVLKLQTPSSPKRKPWPGQVPHKIEQKRPPWAQEGPLLPDAFVTLEPSEPKPRPTEPIVHQVPHVIDRSTGQPLLVNIQPSQVANVVIPQGGTQALIFGDTSEPHKTGQYFDDPSPYPEPETGLGFVGIEKVQDLPQFSNENDPADYMVPPSPPTNFKPLSQEAPRPHAIPLSPHFAHFSRPQDESEVSRPEKRPEVHLIKRPEGPGTSSGQGQVHTEILVHQRPETIEIRPQPLPRPSILSHVNSEYPPPPRREYDRPYKPVEPSPSRRTEISTPTEVPHRYIFPGKPAVSGNDVTVIPNWKRPAVGSRPSPVRPPIINQQNRFKPGNRPGGKPQHSGQRRPAPKPQTNSSPATWSPQDPREPPKNRVPDSPYENTPDQPSQYTHYSQVDLQDRPSHFHSEATVTAQSHIEHSEEHVPTGAIGYHNPSTDPEVKPEDAQYYPQVPTVKPEVQTFGQILPQRPDEEPEDWRTGTQTEQPLIDSETGGSENVKYQNHPHDETSDEGGANVAAGSHREAANVTIHANNSYDTVGSVNAVVGKPLEIGQGITFGQEKPFVSNQGSPILQDAPFTPDYHQSRPYETPVVQGKPFGVYDGHADASKPYGYNQNGGRPEYEIVRGVPFGYQGNRKRPASPKPYAERDDTIDLKPPAIIPQFGPDPDRPSRPHSRPRPETRPEIVAQTPDRLETRPDHGGRRPASEEVRPGHFSSNQGSQKRPDWNAKPQILENDQSQHGVGSEHGPEFGVPSREGEWDRYRNRTVPRPNYGGSFVPTESETSRPGTRPDYGTSILVHPEYPHILAKPKPQAPVPVTIHSGTARPEANGRPNVQFSLPIDVTGEKKEEGEEESKTQTERPPSMLLVMKNASKVKQNEESLETAFQTNFASPDSDDVSPERGATSTTPKPKVPSRDMMPPPPVGQIINSKDHRVDENGGEGLKPPPPPSNVVVGLSPPPVAPVVVENDPGLRPPLKYIPLEDSVVAGSPPPPSVDMVPPSSRPTMARPFLVELLSQDMIPPLPPAPETTRPLEVATVRPAVAVSGSIQIATAVATSHIPVVQDMESKIPIIHGTVDLPVVVDVPEILRPVETRKTEHVSIYTVRPFETRQATRVSVQPTAILTTNLVIPTKLRPPQIDHIEPSRSFATHRTVEPTRLSSPEVLVKSTKRPDRPVHLEPSKENVQHVTRIEPTESLTYIVGTSQNKRPHATKEKATVLEKAQSVESIGSATRINDWNVSTSATMIDDTIRRVTNTLIPKKERPNESSLETTMNIIGTVIHEVVRNGSTATMEVKPKEVTHYKTLTVTRTETSVLGAPPTTRTLLLTHTLTSTIVETVTETLLRPTSVPATVTSTVLRSATRGPSYGENGVDNDSIFVVMSDQKPPAAGAEEVEAEYGEEDISRDEQDPAGNEIHRVLSGGILGAPVIPLEPPVDRCAPECKAFKAEICAEVGTEMRCVCRPGFARMFPDRPCKPTYTYTLRVGLDRIGREPIVYEAALNDTTSASYRRLAAPTKDALDRTLMQSDLRDIYRGLRVTGFNPDPTTVEFHVQLTDNANETRLKEVLRKYLVGSNYSLGGTEVYAARDLDLINARDFDECVAEEGAPHHDCSPNAACFNLRGTYQCSCKEGWADLSENPAYPGRVCSQAPLGCAGCSNKGHCVTNANGQEACECFPWHSGQRCQVNLKVLLIALVTTGAILLGLLAVCVGLACFRRPGRKRKSGDRRAMIPATGGGGGDTSSEGSVTDLAIPHHVPHVLPPPPPIVAPAPPVKKPTRKISGKPRHNPRRKPTVPAPVAVPMNDDQRDRSLTVMIPRAKYRSVPQSPRHCKPVMSAFAADEHKLISYLEGDPHPGHRKHSISSSKEPELQVVRTPVAPSGALVSAGFQVSATVTRPIDAESTLARSCGETTVEPATKILRHADPSGDRGSTLARSCGETTIQPSTKLLRLDAGEAGSTLARSCGETTVQVSTKVAKTRRGSFKDICRDSASEGHTMAERDLGSTLRLPAQHPPLYNPDRTSDRDSNFDSL